MAEPKEPEVFAGPISINLLKWTFYFSQGHIDLQALIFEYLFLVAEKLEPPKEKGFFDKAKSVMVATTVDHPDTHMLIESKKVPAGLKKAMTDARTKYRATRNPANRAKAIEEVVERITEGIINRDHDWLVEKGQRPRRTAENRDEKESKEEPYDAQTDVYMAQVFFYGLQGHLPGHKAYHTLLTQMFERVAAYINNPREDNLFFQGILTRKLEEIRDVYNAHPHGNEADNPKAVYSAPRRTAQRINASSISEAADALEAALKQALGAGWPAALKQALEKMEREDEYVPPPPRRARPQTPPQPKPEEGDGGEKKNNHGKKQKRDVPDH